MLYVDVYPNLMLSCPAGTFTTTYSNKLRSPLTRRERVKGLRAEKRGYWSGVGTWCDHCFQNSDACLFKVACFLAEKDVDSKVLWVYEGLPYVGVCETEFV